MVRAILSILQMTELSLHCQEKMRAAPNFFPLSLPPRFSTNSLLPQGLCTVCPFCPGVSLQGLSALCSQVTCSESLLALTG